MRLVFLLWVLLCSGRLQAHNSPNSTVALDFLRTGVAAELTLPLEELELSFRQPLMAAPTEVLQRYRTALAGYVIAHVNPVAEDGRPWTVELEGMDLQLTQAPFDLVVRLRMQPPPGASARRFTFHYSVINHEVMNHSAFFSVRNDWDTAVFASKPEPLGSLQYTITSLEIDRSAGNWRQGFRSVFSLGVRHIAEGTDHLLFLLVLLLPAPLLARGARWQEYGGLKRSLRELLKIVSAFTLGHSLTLLLGGLGWVHLPGRPVEVLIALSILVSAGHAIRPLFAGREVLLAGGFGLVHGLAFAGSLAEYGFSNWHLALTILAFNLGIEAMQLAVVACTIPWLLLLARTPWYVAVRVAGASLGAVAALGWILERALAWPNPVGLMVEGLARHSSWLVTGLVGLSLLATFARAVPKRRRASLSSVN